MRAKLRAVETELMRRRHLPISDQQRRLESVLRGHHPTTPCPTTSRRYAPSVTKSPAAGNGFSNEAVRCPVILGAVTLPGTLRSRADIALLLVSPDAGHQPAGHAPDQHANPVDSAGADRCEATKSRQC